jgi:hypothetical protein
VKIVFLSTGRGLRPETIDDLRTKLAVHDSDVVAVVSWHPPRVPLPVDRHLVLGPHIRLAGTLATDHRVELPGDRTPAVDTAAGAEPGRPGGTPVESDAEGGDAGAAIPAAGAANRALELSMLHPRRLKQAAAWRVRRLNRAVRTSSKLTGIRTHPTYRKVRGRLSPRISVGFALGCLRAGNVHAMARDADIVVALDAASHRGAWTLAQRVAGPDVVIGLPAAKRLLEQREASAPG